MSKTITGFFSGTLLVTIALCASCAANRHSEVRDTDPQRLLIFGASGRIGGHIVEEALLQGYHVTAVSRDASRLEHLSGRVAISIADILDQRALARLISEHDAVLVSVGGKPASDAPVDYIAHTAANSLIEVMERLATNKRLLFVGNLYTLEYEGGLTLLELGRAPKSHPNYAMFYGHQLALDAFAASDAVNWTVAAPPNGLRLSGRTGRVRWGGRVLLRDADGTPSTISPEDFAYAFVQELENGNYVRKQFNVAR